MRERGRREDALGSIVVLGVLTIAGILATHRRFLRVGMVGPVSLGVAMIGVSRLYLDVHWLTDVLAGWLLGTAWLAVCSSALVLDTRRRASTDLPPRGHSGRDLLLPDVCQGGGRA